MSENKPASLGVGTPKAVGPKMLSISMQLMALAEQLESLAQDAGAIGIVPRNEKTLRWTDEEDEYLKAHAHEGTLQISESIGRSPIAVGHRMRKLEIGPVSKRRAWDAEEDAALLAYESISLEQAMSLSQILGRSVNALRTRHSRLQSQR